MACRVGVGVGVRMALVGMLLGMQSHWKVAAGAQILLKILAQMRMVGDQAPAAVTQEYSAPAQSSACSFQKMSTAYNSLNLREVLLNAHSGMSPSTRPC